MCREIQKNVKDRPAAIGDTAMGLGGKAPGEVGLTCGKF